VVGDPELRRMVEQADLVVPDGMPLIWASRLQRTPLPERVAGSTLVCELPPAAAAAGASVFLLGGAPGVADAAAARLRERSPELEIAGTLCPPYGVERSPAELERIQAAVLAARPDIVFVALGFPRQERLIMRLRPLLPDAWFVSCGISFSFVTGDVARAPRWVQRAGLEWLHRLAQEPRRLARRYLVDGIPFLVRLLASAGRRRVAR
jgi:N-acetylglucosaminyldiphosphoundecaprenol N-acetyl-beta-D-mannosaminyltransferase